MSADPIMAALDEVEDEGADADHDAARPDRGAGHPDLGEEDDARPEGPMPEPDEALPGEQDDGFSVLSWARSVPDGSHTNFDASDWWDPENGAENRLAFHLSDAAGAGAGYPNGLGVLVAFAELYWSAATGSSGEDDGGESGEDDAPTGETVAPSEAEAYV